VLTPDDWELVQFCQRVTDQYINQTPMGAAEGPPILTPRLEGWRAVLRLYGYPRERWQELIDWGRMLDRLIKHPKSVPNFVLELGVPYDDITPEGVTDGTG
jgi:hypothetical protein